MHMALKIGINGFGRIGRQVYKALLEKYPAHEVVAVNDVTDSATNAHLLKYDSNYGVFKATIEARPDAIVVNGKEVKVLSEKDPAKLPWKDLGVQIVLESTGVFTDVDKARAHITGGGAKKVIISAPAKGDCPTIVLGVNEKTYDPAKHDIVSNASCTTNCLAPVCKVLQDSFGIEVGFMTTIHSYTNDQRILDLPHKDLRRARAAALNIIPTSTGAAKALHLVIPELKGKMNGISLRVPTPTVSLVDLVCNLSKDATVEAINAAFKAAAAGPMKGILEYSEEELVSMDLKANEHSAILDSGQTMTIGARTAKVLAWYDNEWAYSVRVADLMDLMAKKL
jgi:glyceraldehyde 3-phosphate dehydrogenase